ncbi:MAG: N-acetylneuraminate synthase [Lachnospiraceae bacterium]|nr:N-acetylneuraminate synthase [Lachnospiraceae bacterium]
MKDRILIIAEAGVNHNGDIETAKKLVDAAAAAGADIIKFQTFRAERLVRRDAKKAAYQLETTDAGESQYEMLKKLELTEEMHHILMEYCSEKNIEFLSTPFDIESMRFLDRLGISVLKLPSGEITNYPYLREAGRIGKKIILSTGMSVLEEVSQAIAVLREHGAQDITVLHCNTQYPTPMGDVNLNAMITMRDQLGVDVGYSDHTVGIEVPIAAAALGARVIEKHFTLDRNMEGPDHKASIEPQELKAMVDAIRNIEAALGDGQKIVSASEAANREVVRKSITAAAVVREGELFTEKNLTTKRPGTGLSPMLWESVLGQRAKRDFLPDEQIEL